MQQNIFSSSIPMRASQTSLSTGTEYPFQRSNRPFVIRRRFQIPFPQRQVSSNSHWTNRQKEKYLLFVSFFRQLFKYQTNEKVNWDIFKGMSKFVQTRNPQQCRSHHLKLIKDLNSIENYIRQAMERISNLSTRIFQVEDKLLELQSQFSLYLSDMGNERSPEKQSKQFTLLNCQQKSLIFQDRYDKNQKQENIKTADSYDQQQNPVKINNNNLGFFSNKSQFKPFGHSIVKKQRSSLPSFETINQQIKPLKQQALKAELLYKSNNNLETIQNKQLNFFNQKKTKQTLFQRISIEKNPQKIKGWVECQFLYELLLNKMQKLVTEPKEENPTNKQHSQKQNQ